jgi:transposase-like protein
MVKKSKSKKPRYKINARRIRGECQELERPLRELSRRGVKRVQLFITDDLPGIENVTNMVYLGSESQLWV